MTEQNTGETQTAGFSHSVIPKEFELQDLSTACTCTRTNPPVSKKQPYTSTKPQSKVSSQDSCPSQRVTKATSVEASVKTASDRSSEPSAEKQAKKAKTSESTSSDSASPDAFVSKKVEVLSSTDDLIRSLEGTSVREIVDSTEHSFVSVGSEKEVIINENISVEREPVKSTSVIETVESTEKESRRPDIKSIERLVNTAAPSANTTVESSKSTTSSPTVQPAEINKHSFASSPVVTNKKPESVVPSSVSLDSSTDGTKPRVRKQLPKIPDSADMSDMETDKSDVKNKSSVLSTPGFGQLHLEYILMSEFNGLHKHDIPGVYVIPSALTPLIWHCVMFIRQGLYKGAIFKFNLNIPDTYPNGESPQVFFEQPVFHPLVDLKTGELDVKREFQKWRRNVHYIWQVLMYTRKVFFKIDTKSPWQPEAAELYEQNMELFKQKVAENIAESVKKAHTMVECNDPHTIRFTPWDKCVHDEAKDYMLCGKRLKDGRLPKNGWSWMKSGTTQIFSKDD